MKFFVGTSGYSYKEWKGAFYPADLKADKMLNYYAGRLPTVEINNTFYRMPRANVLENWAQQVPEDFRFVLKAPRRITHLKRLGNAREENEYLLDTAGTLGDRLGPILYQLPPNFKKDADRLDDFLDILPKGTRAAFEFRHDTWYDDEVYDLLRKKDCALCIADTKDKPGTIIPTTGWGYLRLRRQDYKKPQLAKWLKNIQAQDWKETYVFFKHEDGASGPKLAARFLDLARDA